MSILDDFTRVTPRTPCPVCGKPDWCLVSKDNPVKPSKSICARTPSDRPYGKAGWLYDLTGPSLTKMPLGPDQPTSKPVRTCKTYQEVVQAIASSIGGTPAGDWGYPRADGSEHFRIVRFDLPDKDGQEKPKKQFRPIHQTEDGWRVGDPPGPLPLYLQNKLAQANRAYVQEGEKAADAAWQIGLVATTSAHGSQSAHKTDWTPLACLDEVVIFADHDEAGRKYANDVAAILQRLNPVLRIKIVYLPDLPEHGDIVEFIAAKREAGLDDAAIRAEIEALVEAAPLVELPAANVDVVPRKALQPSTPLGQVLASKQPAADVTVRSDATGGADNDRGQQSQADRLVELAESLELFHTPGQDGYGYALVPFGNHIETWRVGSKPFRYWLGRRYYEQYKKVANSQATQDALNAINGKAMFDGPQQDVFLRVAESDGAHWLDLGNETWQAIKITAAGWSLCDRPPVRFIRARSMLALPTPVPGGSLSELRELLNLPGDEAWALILSWLVQALRRSGPYPILGLGGEQGSGKSGQSRMLRGLIDPNEAPLRAEPCNAHDLMIAANNGWILAFDNLSRVPPWLSDALCRLSTGGGFSTRELYSDSDERIFQAMRPVILNGIEELATRSDLLDRSIVLTLPTIPEAKRRTEAELTRLYEAARPRILGALLSAMAEAIRNLPEVKLTRLPRMADFASWATAAEPGLGLKSGEFLAAYLANRQGTDNAALEASAIGPAIISLMKRYPSWQGTVKELLEELELHHIDEKTRRHRYWPDGPTRFSGQLRRLAPNLRRLGIDVTFGDHSSQGRMLYLEQAGAEPSQPSQPSLILPDGTTTVVSSSTEDVMESPFEPSAEMAATPASDGDDENDGLVLACSGQGREEVYL